MGIFVRKSSILWESRNNCTYLKTLPGETSDLPSSAALSQYSVLGDHIRHSDFSVNTGGIPRVAWGVCKTALVVVTESMT